VKLKSTILALLFFSSSLTLAKVTWRQIDKSIGSSTRKERVVIHQAVLKIVSSIDYDRENLRKKTTFWSLLINDAIAGNTDRCFFGGWISLEVNGDCQPPWRMQNNSAFKSQFEDQTYTPEYYCSNRSDVTDSSNMVRCNPSFYGADSEGAKCVSMTPNSSITERCHQASTGLIDNHIENFLSSSANRSRYATLVAELINFCSDHRNYTCHSMAKQLTWQLEQMRDNEAVNLCAHGFVDDILEVPDFEEILRLVSEPPEEVPEIWAPPIEEDFLEACNIEGMTEEAKANCQALLGSGDIPRNALLFTLEGMKRNASEFKTNQCFDGRPEFETRFSDSNGYKHHSLVGLDSSDDFEAKLEGGITNKCSMVINDVGNRLESHGGSLKCRMKTFHINLCGDAPRVRETAAWVGYGTCKKGNGHKNKEGEGTTLLGFHVTGAQTFNFGKDDGPYNQIRSNYARSRQNRIPSLALFGLQNSNNGSMTDYKYIHIGAYTSAGCPSLMATDDNYDLIEELAANGPSVVVNYKEGEMEPFQKCEEQ